MSTGAVGTLPARSVNSARQILVASLMGTAIEFFDFYIYATAAVLVFPRQFFPSTDPATATLASMATFAIAFLARPIGSALFGHFGDRVGRKTTLVAALLTMGISTVAIGALPTYQSIGLAAPLLLAVCRFGQGLGLGGEWGGAILLATENAPPGKRAWYGMFPQLGAPIGFFCSGGIFLLLSRWLTDEQFFAWGWRVPFLSSAVLVIIGLYVRLAITETPVFAQAVARARAGQGADGDRVQAPRAGAGARHRHRHLGLRDLLPDDGVHPVVGHGATRLQPQPVPDHPAGRRGVLRPHRAVVGAAGRARATVDAHGGQRRHGALRPGDGSALPSRAPPAWW